LKKTNLRRFPTPFHIKEAATVDVVDPRDSLHKSNFRRLARVRHDFFQMSEMSKTSENEATQKGKVSNKKDLCDEKEKE
jgi:hypothetical protein